MADVTIDQLRKMTAYEIELGKELDNEYNNPAPPMPEPVHGENNSQSIFISNEGYSTGRTIEQTDFQNPSATTTTTIRQTTTTTTSSTTLHNQTTSTTTTSTSTTTTTTTTVATTTTSTTTTTSSTSTSTSTTTTTTTTVATTTTTSSTTTSTTTEATTTTSSTTSTTTTTTSTSTTTTTTTEAPVISQFNFNNAAQSVVGWIDVSGQPHTGVLTANDPTTGITVSSIVGKWTDLNGDSAALGGQNSGNPTFTFPQNVTNSYWFTNGTTWSVTGANLEISGLVPGGLYKIEILGSRQTANVPQTDRLTAYYCQDVNGLEANEAFDVKGNTVNVQTFEDKEADSAGKILLGIHKPPTGDETNGYLYGYLNGLRITKRINTTFAKFNFALSGANFGTPTGWVPVYGNPNAGIITVTDTGQNGAKNSGIGISSVGTATALWNPAGGSCANNTIGPSVANPRFIYPSAVIRSVWYTNLALYITGNENLLITGLVPGASYKIEMLGGRDGAAIPAANSYCTYVCIDNVGTSRVDNYDIKNNTAVLQIFNNKVAFPEGTPGQTAGTIKLAVFRKSDSADGGMVIGYINAIRVIKI